MMKASFFLVVQGCEKQFGNLRAMSVGTIKTTKNKPSLASDEICVKLYLDIPDALFRRPTLVASITVPDIAEPVVSADFADRLSDLVREQMGVTLHIEAAKGE
jgi:hypothetical protein